MKMRSAFGRCLPLANKNKNKNIVLGIPPLNECLGPSRYTLNEIVKELFRGFLPANTDYFSKDFFYI